MGDEQSQHGRLPHGTFSNLTPLQTTSGSTSGDFQPSGFARTDRSPQNPNQANQMDVERVTGGQYPQMGSYASGHLSRTSPLNMAGMANALPDYQSTPLPFSQQAPQALNIGPTSPAVLYQLQQATQFAGQTPGQNPQYSGGHFQNYPNVYQTHQGYSQMLPSPQQQGGSAGPNPIQPSFLNQPFYAQHPQQAYVSQFAQQQQGVPVMQPRVNPYQQSYGRRSSGSYGQGPLRPDQDFRSMGGMYGIPDPGTGAGLLQPLPGPGLSRQSSGASSTGPSAPRGPPRKPKQSGHALWVGNLPPGTNVLDLKEHFSKDAMKDIESVFLISKSNCAFVNYRTEASCAAAMTRFHDSRFQGVRLVCRLRRGSTAPASGTPTGPSAAKAPSPDESTNPALDNNALLDVEPEPSAAPKDDEPVVKSKEKYFIVKSLTVDDLEMSVRNGIWATQAHNEAALNKAYESSENVYLIFSANKSGEYFGYARMASPINEESASNFEWVPKTSTSTREPEAPSTIPTLATEVAPKGRIIDDSARGTIFWEADPLEPVENPGEDSKSEKSVDETEDIPGNQSFGKPFKIEWMSTERLPFFRTRGLRNPWNANREVKIARDGQPVEENVGRRLTQMFHRPLPPGGRPTPPMPMGFPPPRQF